MWEAGSIQCNCISPRSVFLTNLPAACSKWTGTLGSEVSIELNIVRSCRVILVFVCVGTQGQPLCWLVYTDCRTHAVVLVIHPLLSIFVKLYLCVSVKLYFVRVCTFVAFSRGHLRLHGCLVLSIISVLLSYEHKTFHFSPWLCFLSLS